MRLAEIEELERSEVDGKQKRARAPGSPIEASAAAGGGCHPLVARMRPPCEPLWYGPYASPWRGMLYLDRACTGRDERAKLVLEEEVKRAAVAKGDEASTMLAEIEQMMTERGARPPCCWAEGEGEAEPQELRRRALQESFAGELCSSALQESFAGELCRRALQESLVGELGRRAWQESLAGELGRRAWQESLAGAPCRRAWQESLAGELGRRALQESFAGELCRRAL